MTMPAVNSAQHIPKCVICNLPLTLVGVETAKLHFFSPASISNSCIKQIRAFETQRLLLRIIWEAVYCCSVFKFSFVSSTCWFLHLVPGHQKRCVGAAAGLHCLPWDHWGPGQPQESCPLCTASGQWNYPRTRAWWTCGLESDQHLNAVQVWPWSPE